MSLTRLALVAVASFALSACAPTAQPITTTTQPPTATTTPVATTLAPTTAPSPDTTQPTTTTSAPTTTTTTLPPLAGLAYETVASLSYPVEMTPVPGIGLSYVITKDGRVWAYNGTEVLPEPVMDISDSVRNKGEQGLLSIAVHPDDVRRVFLHYSANNGDTVVAEYQFVNGAGEPSSERILLRVGQPASNHNGGMIQFGPDGMLYLGLGDGGGANDRFRHGQNQDSLLGGLVQIDVDSEEASLFSYGLRNPWRFWIEDELIYIADVGQNAYEEVSVSPLEEGLNFGWPITEGLHCFRPSSGCDTDGLTLPVIEVSHGDGGTCSITGGIVYSGSQIPEVQGHYFYSDFCGGYLRSFVYGGGSATDMTDWTGDVGVPGSVVGFGLDHNGEMYVSTTREMLKVVPVRG